MSITGPVIALLRTHTHDQCACPGCQQALAEQSVDAATEVVPASPIREHALLVYLIPRSRR